MQIHIEQLTIHPCASSDALASLERLMQSLGRAEVPAAQTAEKPVIGAYWPHQGGFYAGDMRGDDGTVYGLIISDCGANKDSGTSAWGPTGEHELSEWDGLANTLQLGAKHPAATLATSHTADQHTDFYLPARRELQLACATVPDLFGHSSWYWSSTPYSSDYTWAVDFENGNTDYYGRGYEFRVRPVRRFIY